MANKSSSLDHELNRILKSHSETAVSTTLKEIESNHQYINEVQLKKLVQLHDSGFQEKCVAPVTLLYNKYSDIVLQNGDLQNWAEIVDRDLRVLENTLQLVRENRNNP